MNMAGDTIREMIPLNIIDKAVVIINYVAIDTGMHKINFIAWDSNARGEKLETIATMLNIASFSFFLAKQRGPTDFIINSKNPVNVTLT